MERYLIAHDLGTSGDKASLFTTAGRLLKSAVYSYSVEYGSGNRAEQNPEDWWRAFCATNRQLLEGMESGRVEAVSFSGQMQGCVLVDWAGRPLRNAMIWADLRAVGEEVEIRSRIPDWDFYRLTGHRPSSAYSAEKLMWVRAHQPELYRQAHRMLGAKDYLVARLTGRFLTDYSDASGTNLLDINTLEWSGTLLNLTGIDGGMLPELCASTEVAGEVPRSLAEECGLPPGTAVVLGGGDGMCASVGAGSVRPGVTYNCLGSSSWIATTTEAPLFDPEMLTFNFAHVVPGLIGPCGTMQAAGISYDWMAGLYYAGELAAAGHKSEVFRLVDREIEAAMPGAGGLLYLPYLLGERSPRWNPLARGALIGLRAEHTRGEIMRSVVEGVAMNLKVILDVFRREDPVTELVVLGGLAKGGVVRQILADVFGVPLRRLALAEEATSIGAAVTAGVGCGLLDGFDRVTDFLAWGGVERPDPQRQAFYTRACESFELAYRQMEAVYDRLPGLVWEGVDTPDD